MTLPTIATPTYTLVQPSTGDKITYRPFLVKEEKILLMAAESDDPADLVDAIRDVVENCCTGLESLEALPLFDLEYIFLQLRSKSIGETIEPVIACPSCQQPIKLKIDLSKVQVTKPKRTSMEVRLTDEVGVRMRYPSYETFRQRLQVDNLSVEQAFAALVDCIELIYDSEQQYSRKDYNHEELSAFVEGLTQQQFQKLQDFFDDIPTLEHTVSYTCRNKVQSGEEETTPCGHKDKVTLSGVNDFFV